MSGPDPVAPSDAEIVRASLSHPGAFGSIFDRHFDAVYGYLVRRGGATLADELTGAVFETAFQTRRRFDLQRTSARPWLYGIAANTLRRHRRTSSRRAAAYRRWSGSEPAGTVDGLGEVEAAIDAGRRSAELRVALAKLAPRDREPLLLHVWEDLSYAEIAEALALPIGTVRSRLHRARTQLRASLARAAAEQPARQPSSP